MKNMLRLLVALVAVCVLVLVARALPDRAPMQGDAEISTTDALGNPITILPSGLVDAGASLGLLLLGSWLAGRIAKGFNLPKISGYLLFGILVGPDILSLVEKDHLPYLRLVNDLALSIIALTAGGEIRLAFVRQAAKAISTVVVGQMFLVLIGVTLVATFTVRPLGLTDADTFAEQFSIALLIGTIASASSPAVVVAIITELRASGPLTQLLLASVVSKDLILVALFAVVMAVSSTTLLEGDDGAPAQPPQAAQQVESAELPVPLEGDDAASATESEPDGHGDHSLPMTLTIELGGSLLAGVLLGIGLAWYVHVIHAHLPIFVVLASFGIALVSEALGLEAIIVALVAGMLMRNIWEEGTAPLFHTIEDLSLPVYCVFFAVAGAKLDLDALSELWIATLLFVGVRAFCTVVGVWAGVKAANAEPVVRKWLWTGFLPQAGVSLVLASIVQDQFAGRPFADMVFNLSIAMIAIHELLGPILLKFAISRAGEAGGERQAREGDGKAGENEGGPSNPPRTDQPASSPDR